jgi:transposase
MGFREVRVFEVREVLRHWLRGRGLRAIEKVIDLDRKTIRRYVDAAVAVGLRREGGEDQLTDELLGQVLERVRPHRTGGVGEARARLEPHKDRIRSWLETDGLTVAKVHVLLSRMGVEVPRRTLERFCAELCGPRRGRPTTVRVDDGKPGEELQVDFGRMGPLFDAEADRRRIAHALVFTAVVSRHCFVWLCFSQTLADLIEGFEAAWSFFGGVFRVVIPDNMSSVVDRANPLEPRLNQGFVEYAQDRGFLVDAARVRHPQDKPRVERTVGYVRRSFFQGETFVDLHDARRRAEQWCRTDAGLRVHGTTQCRPAEHFSAVEHAALLALPDHDYDVPHYATAKVHRDHHVEVRRSLYSVPGSLIGRTVEVRADSKLVKVFFRGELVKTHPRQAPGQRSTDPCDLPTERTAYAMRDLERLCAMATVHGEGIGSYARTLLDHPLPWTKMRQVYALLGLVKRFGAARVEEACRKAADAEAYSVPLVSRMLQRATESSPTPTATQPTLLTGRFVRPDEDFAIRQRGRS